MFIFAGLGIVGCGDDPPGPADTVRTFYSSLADGNAETACNQLVRGALPTFVWDLGDQDADKGCRDTVPVVRARLDTEDRADLKKIRIRSEEVDGGKARVETGLLPPPLQGISNTLELENVEGHWRISSLGIVPR